MGQEKKINKEKIIDVVEIFSPTQPFKLLLYLILYRRLDRWEHNIRAQYIVSVYYMYRSYPYYYYSMQLPRVWYCGILYYIVYFLVYYSLYGYIKQRRRFAFTAKKIHTQKQRTV